MPKLAAIGAPAAGWAARARLMGWEVAAFDLADGVLHSAMDRAHAFIPALYDVALPAMGPLQRAESVADAVMCADLIVADIVGDLGAVVADIPCLASTVSEGVFPIVYVAPHIAHFEQIKRLLGLLGVQIQAHSDIPPDWLQPDNDLAMVSVLRALKARRAGIGAFLADYEAQFAPQAPDDLSQPPVTLARQVPPDWVDYNGHMNEARYLTAFSDATDRLLLWAGMDADCIAQGHSVFTVETHIQHLGEVHIGDQIEVRSQVLEGAGKRLHLWHDLWRCGAVAATAEQLLLHVDLTTRRVGLPRADVGAWLDKAAQAQAGLAQPQGVGRFVGAPR